MGVGSCQSVQGITCSSASMASLEERQFPAVGGGAAILALSRVPLDDQCVVASCYNRLSKSTNVVARVR